MIVRMTLIPPEFFRRQDEEPDERFYAVPRPDSHLDDVADAVVAGWYDERLPVEGAVLDLFAGARSHLPERVRDAVGVGLDRAALARNPQLRAHHVLDLNHDPSLPFADGSLAAVVCTASVQYLTRPIDLLREVGRVPAPWRALPRRLRQPHVPDQGGAVLAGLGRRSAPSPGAGVPRRGRRFRAPRPRRPPPARQGEPLYLIATRADPSVAPD